MKKWLCVLLVGLLLCGLTACDNTSDKSKSSGTTTATTTATNTTTGNTEQPVVYVIIDPSVYVYSGPSADTEVVGLLHAGDEVEILSGSVETWFRIAYSGGVGYVLKSYIGVKDAPGVTLSGISEVTSEAKTTTSRTTATTTRPTTAAPTVSTTKTTGTTVPTTTATTNSYTAADLFFPLDSSSVTPPKSATMADASISFDDAQRRVRLQLPDSLTVKTAQHGGHTYAALYHGNKRVGRVLANYLYPDTVSGTVAEEKTVTIDGVDVQTMSYTAGADTATTYYSFLFAPDNFFYTLEISADYISQTDFAACVSSMQIVELLARNNRLDCRNQDDLRIAIAGNSFISSSQVAPQLQRMLAANGKNAAAQGFSYPNITVSQIAADPQIMHTLCDGNYDVLFLCSAYYSEDVDALSVVEQACQKSGTELVLFPAHNEGTFYTELAYRNTNAKLAHWKVAIDNLISAGIPESSLIMYDGPRHSTELAGYCGAVMIYGMLYETAPNTAAIGASFSGLPFATAQRVENLTMEYIRAYFE